MIILFVACLNLSVIIKPYVRCPRNRAAGSFLWEECPESRVELFDVKGNKYNSYTLVLSNNRKELPPAAVTLVRDSLEQGFFGQRHQDLPLSIPR
jgi:hypothetical protein